MSDSPTHARRAAAHYLAAADLAKLVCDYRRTGTVPEALGRALLQIAGGVWDRYRFTSDRDDFVQEVTLHLLQRPLEKADAQKHVFNYFTTCAIRFGLKMRDKAHVERRRFETYAQECVEAGRQIPTTNESADPHNWSDDVDPKGHFEPNNGLGRLG